MDQPRSSYRLFCPGPTPVPPEAQAKLLQTNFYHRTPEFKSVQKACCEKLAPIFGTKERPVIFSSSGTGAMEAAVLNFTNQGDDVLVLHGGKFGQRWLKLNKVFQNSVKELPIKWGYSPDLDELESILSKSPESLKAVFFQANETSTGVFFPLNKICSLIKKHRPDALIVVDAISGAVAHPIEMDKNGIDIVLSGSQKGFGVPPGLAFLAASERARNRISTRPKFYFDFEKEYESSADGTAAWTPATGLIFALAETLDIITTKGIGNIWKQHEQYAGMVRAAGLALGLKPLVTEDYSHAVTSLVLPEVLQAKNINKRLRDDYGCIFAGGQDDLKGKIIRFGHLGIIDEVDIMAGLGALEMVLQDCQYSVSTGAGIRAALDFRGKR